MKKIIKIQNVNGFEPTKYQIQFVEENGGTYAEVFENGIYIVPADWPGKISRHIDNTIDKLTMVKAIK